MARVVRVIEYLGTEEHLKTWLEHSCADGVSPMFAPHQMTIWTVESDVPGILGVAGSARSEGSTGSPSGVLVPGSGRPLVKYEDYSSRSPWMEECRALDTILGYWMRGTGNAEYPEHSKAAQRVLDRVWGVLSETRGRT
jgi:hypothetical protein